MLVLAAAIGLGGLVGLGAQEPLQELFWRHYIDFREEQVYQTSVKSPAELAQAGNIFYLGVEEGEWRRLEGLLDEYFRRLGQEGFRAERLAALERALRGHNVQLDTCDPVGYYSLWQDRVYLDRGLFGGQAEALFVKSVLYHEKVHENQLKRLDLRALRVDQKQRYQNKLQEIGAHYMQIRWVLEREGVDGPALELVLANSAREGMVPNLLRYYPDSDPVVQVIRLYLRKYTGT